MLKKKSYTAKSSIEPTKQVIENGKEVMITKSSLVYVVTKVPKDKSIEIPMNKIYFRNILRI